MTEEESKIRLEESPLKKFFEFVTIRELTKPGINGSIIEFKHLKDETDLKGISSISFDYLDEI